MQQHNWQLNTANMIVERYDRVFVSCDAKIISFSCDYLKQFNIKKR